MSEVESKSAANKTPFSDWRIRIWAPMDDRDPYAAKIGSLQIIFYGKTPMQASMKAEAWRKEELAKMDKRGSRHNDAIPEPDPLEPGDT